MIDAIVMEPDADAHTRWEELYAASRPQLYRAAAFLVGAAEGEELIQDAFERAMRQERFLDTVREPEAWLRRVVVRLAISRLRRRAVWKRIRSTLVQQAPERDLDLEAAIARLPPSQRGAIVLFYYFDAAYTEIAATLGLSETSVSTTLTRAREALRRALQ